MRTLLLFVLLASQAATAKDVNHATIDVYGTEKISAKQIIEDSQSEINKISNYMQNCFGNNLNKQIDIFAQASTNLVSKIQARGDFAYVKISPITYQHDPVTHITVDVIESKDKYRLEYFTKKPEQTIPDSHNLLREWQKYEKEGVRIIFGEKQKLSTQHCPAYHCIYGFENPRLNKYQVIFSQAEKYKTNLVDILRHDKNELKRAAAVFVLAHIDDEDELIKYLIPAINDPSSRVRNNTMRVLGAIASQNPEANIPLDKIVQALDFPATTDRNKALYILSSLAKKSENVEYIKIHAGKYLLATLKLVQPNNHDFSYQILKTISGKNYGERDYKSWEAWLKA